MSRRNFIEFSIILVLVLNNFWVLASTLQGRARTKVLIAGGGPAGLLAAHCLLSRNDKYEVEIVESREDPRQTQAGPRSYSLGLNIRGQAAINYFDNPKRSPGLWQSLKKLGVESDSFFLHIGSKKIQLRKPAAKDESKEDSVPPTLLIPRNKLCVGMLENLETLHSASGRLSVTFNSKLLSVDLENKVANFDEQRHLVEGAVKVSKQYDLIIGADGVQSELRNAMKLEGESPTVGSGVDSSLENVKSFRCEEVILPGQYKVMLQAMPTSLEFNAVHAMEVGKKAGYGLFLIPSPGNQTCALLSWKGDTTPPILTESADPATVKASIAANYPLFGEPTDAAVSQLAAQRPSSARTVRCNRYHRAKKGVSSALIMGDAAHSTGGTLGQGANSALMDVVALDKCLDETSDDISAALPLFSRRQVLT
jgi:kynurenine 3-monooxygenase